MLRFLRLPRRIPVRLPERQAALKWLVPALRAVLATTLLIAWRDIKVISDPILDLDEGLYDVVYRLRPAEDRTASNVVIVAIDQPSLTKLDEGAIDDVRVAWPWPRELYGDMLLYF